MVKNDDCVKVYCIVNKRTKALYEVCASLDVAKVHVKQDCYNLVKSWGFETEIVERVIWTK